MEFVAIDFETATNSPDSACAVGIVYVKNEEIIEEFYSLIQPPDNQYLYHNTRVHGITAKDTETAPTFADIYPKIKELMKNKLVVAHNESFDRNVLYRTMESHGLSFQELNIKSKWECTVKIFRKKGNFKVNLAACCQRYDIPLDHHNALSDARACAKLYLIHKYPLLGM
ncbi:MAG: 3'-5' exonuclease [Cytophagaceae bacterium]|nr:3'-5' exonuclease [Cytophagaceae bacterium]MBL0325603.1 3'-5' exonuclease [Cytophagaceae bacterium]